VTTVKPSATMTICYVHDDANADLDELFGIDLKAATATYVLLETLFADEVLAEKLHVNNDVHYFSPDFHNLLVSTFSRKGYTIYRLKYHDGDGQLMGYRILHAYHGRVDCSYVLAIMERQNAYDHTHWKINRLFGTYDTLGIYRESGIS